MTEVRTIGILGGGQLGRMLALAAAQLGYRTHIYTPERDSVAADVAAEATIAPFGDPLALGRFASACDVLTFEFENIPTGQLAFLGDRLAPSVPGLAARGADPGDDRGGVRGDGHAPGP